jgi:hypothetical protein
LVQTTPDIGLSGAVCTPGVTSSQMVRSSSENDRRRLSRNLGFMRHTKAQLRICRNLF